MILITTFLGIIDHNRDFCYNCIVIQDTSPIKKTNLAQKIRKDLFFLSNTLSKIIKKINDIIEVLLTIINMFITYKVAHQL